MIRSFAAGVALLLGLGLGLTACSNDDTENAPKVKEGVIFRFQRKLVYASGVNEIGSVKITLTKGSEKIVLPSSKLKGDEDCAETAAFSLPAGNYALTAYTAYDQSHNWLFDMELDSKNEFTVNAQGVTSFVVPVKSREILNQNFIRNALMGLCREVFGEDENEWPWDPTKYPYPDWEGLEFEFDDYGSPMYIASIHFDGLKEGKETPWVKMTELPDGTLSNIATLDGIVFTDLPNFTKLAEDLEMVLSLKTISCINTGLNELPDNFSKLDLHAVNFINCKLTEFPSDISAMKDLHTLTLYGNELTEFNTDLTKLPKLISVDLTGNPLTSIGDHVFAADGALNELSLRNTNLSKLPAVIKNMAKLRSIDLEGCRFTAVPAEVKGNAGLKTVWLGNNPITSVSAADFAGMTNLDNLFLNECKLTSLPKLSSSNLMLLDVTGCGLTATPDLSGLPALRVLYAGNNKFSTLPANYFAANPEMRILSLANSAELTSIPAGDLGLRSKISEKAEGFKLLDMENCPSLRWQTPASWQCYDFTGKTADDLIKEKGPETRRPDIGPGDIYDEYFGRVAVKREGSPGITFGK